MVQRRSAGSVVGVGVGEKEACDAFGVDPVLLNQVDDAGGVASAAGVYEGTFGTAAAPLGGERLSGAAVGGGAG